MCDIMKMIWYDKKWYDEKRWGMVLSETSYWIRNSCRSEEIWWIPHKNALQQVYHAIVKRAWEKKSMQNSNTIQS